MSSKMRLPLWAAIFFSMVTTLFLLTALSGKAADYSRTGWQANLSTLAHGVSGVAEIVDERTIVLRNFNYDGGGPAVYAYLGTENSNPAFETGLSMMPLLTRIGQPYVNETITVTLPISGANLDGFLAISIWCEDFKINFGSGVFQEPAATPTPTVTITPTSTPLPTTVPPTGNRVYLPLIALES